MLIFLSQRLIQADASDCRLEGPAVGAARLVKTKNYRFST
jgi:hypothetical protein